MGLLIEGGCLGIALLLGLFGWYDRSQPLSRFGSGDWTSLAFWSLAGLAGCGAIALVLLWMPFEPFRKFREFVREVLEPLFSPLAVWQIALLAASAGIGEEMLFRWCIQGGLQNVLSEPSGTWSATLIASVLFGLCHAVGVLYVVFATLIGILMGWIMVASGSVIPAILAHGLYDFIAILVLQWSARRRTAGATGQRNIF
jgi:membrane protease YdiL (CAAX protease family)